MTKKQKCLLAALATGALVFATSCACLAPQQSKMTVEELRANNKNVIVQAKLLSDSIGEHAAKIRNAADANEYFAVEVKFFERTADQPSCPGSAPKVAVLDKAAADKLINRFNSDRKTSTVNYPRVLVKNRSPLEIASVVNQPVITSSGEKNGQIYTKIGALPIGTRISACATRLKNGKIDLATAIIIS